MEDNTEMESPAEALAREEYFRGLKEGEKLAVDRAEIFEKSRKLAERYGIFALLLGTAVVYGGGRTFSFLTAIFGWVKAEVVNDLRHIQAWYLERGYKGVDKLKDKLEGIGAGIGLWINISFIVLVAFKLLVVAGIAFGSGIWIAIAGGLTGGFFWILGWALQKAATGMLVLLEIKKEEKSEYSKKFRGVYWLAVLIWTASFYWAIFSSWAFYGFSFIAIVGVLAISGLTHTKGWSSTFWKFYKKWIAVPSLVIAFVSFGLTTAFPNTWNFVWGKASDDEKFSLRAKTDHRLVEIVQEAYKKEPPEVIAEPLEIELPAPEKVVQVPVPVPVVKKVMSKPILGTKRISRPGPAVKKVELRDNTELDKRLEATKKTQEELKGDKFFE